MSYLVAYLIPSEVFCKYYWGAEYDSSKLVELIDRDAMSLYRLLTRPAFKQRTHIEGL